MKVQYFAGIPSNFLPISTEFLLVLLMTVNQSGSLDLWSDIWSKSRHFFNFWMCSWSFSKMWCQIAIDLTSISAPILFNSNFELPSLEIDFRAFPFPTAGNLYDFENWLVFIWNSQQLIYSRLWAIFANFYKLIWKNK